MARRYSGKLISSSMRSVAGIDYELQRRRMKMIRLRVRRSDGAVVVSAPAHATIREIEGFVASRADWIREQRDALGEQETERLRQCVTGETISVWGDNYELEVTEARKYQLELGIDGVARMRVPKSSSAESRRAWIREWYRGEIKTELGYVFEKWQDATGLYANDVRCKWMTSRWGSCVVRKRRINLNIQLAKYPPRLLDYVIVHELCHLRVANHGPDFYALMDEFMPDWQDRRSELNNWKLDYTE